MDRQRHTYRANFKGLNTQLLPDAMPMDKFPAAVNVRAEGDTVIRTRPGYTKTFETGGIALTDMRAYSTLGTDNRPRILVHDSGGGVWLDNGVKQGTVGVGGTGASLIPFRPNQSPQSWMYIGNGTGYKKFEAPDASNNVLVYDAGIEEPQDAPSVCPDIFYNTDFSSHAVDWTISGTAGVLGNGLFSDTAGVALADPAGTSRFSVQVAASSDYYRFGRDLNIVSSVSGSFNCTIEDVLPAVTSIGLTISSILYFSGTTGRCVIVPTQMPYSESIPVFEGDNPSAGSIFGSNVIGSLRRGSLIQIGAEICFVLSVTVGPDGQFSFEVQTASAHAAGEALVGIPAISISGVNSSVAGQLITISSVGSSVTVGTGNISQLIGGAANPFARLFQNPLVSTKTPQQDDYLCFSIQMDKLNLLTSGRIIFDINAGGAVDYVTNAFYYQFTPASLLNQVITTSTIYPTAKWFTLVIPINSLIRLGSDSTKTLANTQGVRFELIVTGTVAFSFGSLQVGGGSQPDVGETGSPYFYRVRGRNSKTGAKGNPSPSTRYGVSPRRQPVRLVARDTVLDIQMDTWDVFRYGGTVTSFRYIGSMANSFGGNDMFQDDFFDDAAGAGSLIEFDNFQPWPTVDVPFIATAGVDSNGVTTAIRCVGTTILLTYSAAAPFTSPAPASILDWLPGTLFILGGQSAYTLWNRPTLVTLASPPAANYYAYLFQFVENIGNPTVTVLTVNEPNVANQALPYLWGPDANGVVFGAGDPYRPGVLYSSKQNNPDSSPNNVYDLTPPSEPLLGGEVINGLALVGSSKRWWVIQAALGSDARWQLIETPAGRGLAAPYGHCTDGKAIFFWGKDGIYNMIPGMPALSLTDIDIASLFPHDGVEGNNTVYGGKTFYAPDYGRTALFRLSVVNSVLRAHYRDSNGTPRTLVLDMIPDSTGNPRMAWSQDEYAHPILLSYQIEQPPGTLETFSPAEFGEAFFGDSSGIVYLETPDDNDDGTPIACVLATAELNGGDSRVRRQWLDAMVDGIPASPYGLTVTPLSGGSAVGTASTIVQSSSREIVLAALGNPIQNYLGLKFSWTDDFDQQAFSTKIMEWSPEFVAQPVQIRSWQSVPTSHGLQGYHHIRKIVFAYQSDEEVILTITAYDGTSPDLITLPSTSGAYQKVEFVPTYNKGLLFTYMASSEGEWAPILPDCEIHVGQWQRNAPYNVFTDLGGAEAA